jgi:hypothetical protein
MTDFLTRLIKVNTLEIPTILPSFAHPWVACNASPMNKDRLTVPHIFVQHVSPDEQLANFPKAEFVNSDSVIKQNVSVTAFTKNAHTSLQPLKNPVEHLTSKKATHQHDVNIPTPGDSKENETESSIPVYNIQSNNLIGKAEKLLINNPIDSSNKSVPTVPERKTTGMRPHLLFLLSEQETFIQPSSTVANVAVQYQNTTKKPDKIHSAIKQKVSSLDLHIAINRIIISAKQPVRKAVQNSSNVRTPAITLVDYLKPNGDKS